MASLFEDTSAWRLRAPGSGTVVPFKLLSTEGEFDPTQGGVTVVGLIPSNMLTTFIPFVFPEPIRIGNVTIPQSVPLPGLAGLIAGRLSFRSQDDSKPVDPFGFDPDAPSGTYHSVLEVTIEYGPRANQQPSETNPFTFLEISANASGEFIYSTAPGSKWQPKSNPNVTEPDTPPDTSPRIPAACSPADASQAASTDQGQDAAEDPDTGKPSDCAENPVVAAPEANRDPTAPIVILVPQTEWTIKWNQIPFDYFGNVLIHRLRACLGRVNSNRFPVLYNATRETLLFTGYSFTHQYTWRNGEISTPPINLEMKILEKRVLWKGVIRGHNDFWRPGVGWETLLIDGVNKTYQERDFGILFKV